MHTLLVLCYCINKLVEEHVTIGVITYFDTETHVHTHIYLLKIVYAIVKKFGFYIMSTLRG